MFVGSYMTPDPVIVSPDTNFPQAMNLIRKHNIRRLPVIEKERLVGIVVHADLLSTQPSPATTLSLYEIYSLIETIRMRQIMSRPVITVEQDCPLEEAARIMVDNTISCLPVMQGDKLVGIITETDIFKALVLVLGGSEAGMRFTLSLPNRVGELASIAGRIAEAGGNIIAVTISGVRPDSQYNVTIKERGADQEALMQSMQQAQIEILDVRSSSRYQPRMFG
ncbi:MAG: CBS domain-containing protein [Anaerolineales bacterium]|nr:CBS domain-containing protein [Anaerolineales bacterium]